MTPTFLEISGRQVGKTHDLVQAAIRHAEESGVAIVVTSEGLADDISRRAPGAIVVTYGQHTNEEMLERVSEMEQVRWFFDEFDWYQDVPVIPGSYYCTTPRFIRRADADPAGDTLLILTRELGGPTYQRSLTLEVEDYYTAEERELFFHGKYQELAA